MALRYIQYNMVVLIVHCTHVHFYPDLHGLPPQRESTQEIRGGTVDALIAHATTVGRNGQSIII